ncbi:MAG TPA: hypothetical protein VKJ45_27345 [Blastocatellia bacterium]|nr:hypothetical protein [Blastocatellia bacterium]
MATARKASLIAVMAAVLAVLSLGIIWCVWSLASRSVEVDFFFTPVVATPFWVWVGYGLLGAVLVLFICWQRRKQH